ncbi:hypothetical protein HUJ04_005056 [Dendroctonus ponderosae]|uniref:Cuticle protein CPCFC domain-containing protein n=1 Tax=Dendroctonus ponderosae TaxID=77166 RepID=A0AAR5QDQ8_DENPD|nr:hypothetical protein HUJ04_005056 [Dendroctonus ponderosae]
MFYKLVVLACSMGLSLAQYSRPQYQQVQYEQQPQYQQQAQYQQPQYQQEASAGPAAAQYPAGVDAQSCPNYPDCANPLLTVQAVAKASDPRYLVDNAPQAPPRAESQYSPDIQQKLDRGEYIGDGDYHGEGLDDALAPQVAANARYIGQQSASPQYSRPSPSAAQYSAQPSAGSVQYPAQQAASQYSAQPGAVQYTAQRAASQYITQPSAVQYPAQQAASQYTTQAQGAQYGAQRAASQYISTPQYITAPQSVRASQYYQRPSASGSQHSQASLYTPQYLQQPAPVHESRSYSPVANSLAAGSEPVPAVQLPAGVDANVCPNYPFCHS